MTTISSGCQGKRQHYGPRGGTGSYLGGGVGAAALLAGSLLLLLSGCGAAKPPKYYQLTVPGEGAPALATATLPVSIVVAPLVAPDLYRDDRLVYGIGAQEMGTYEHQRWVAPPPQMIQQVMLRELRASDRYQSVYSPDSSVRGDYTLRGHLYDFKELDSGSSLVARVTMDLELRDYKSGAIVWKHYYTHDEPVSVKTVPAVVAALNQNVQLAVGQVTSGLDEYFAAHPVK
jgi:ABC-type uncharacterized transport system auxiliary subunit